MQLRVLTDNYTYIDEYYVGEPGLSIFIEAEGKRFLFDIGYSDVFLQNAKQMQIDLGELDGIIFSHGHDDHTAGLSYLLVQEGRTRPTVIAHPLCMAPKRRGSLAIGSPLSQEQIAASCDLRLSAEPLRLTEHLLCKSQALFSALR